MRQRSGLGPPVPDKRGPQAEPASHARASTNAGLDRRVPTHLLVANRRSLDRAEAARLRIGTPALRTGRTDDRLARYATADVAAITQ